MTKNLFWSTLWIILLVNKPSFGNFSDIEVDRIEIVGVSAFEEKKLETVLEVNVGDLVDKPKIIRTTDNLKTLYKINGYDDAQVKSELVRIKPRDSLKVENILKFSIFEGKPTKIYSFEFERSQDVSEIYWSKAYVQLLKSVSPSLNQVLSQDRQNELKRTILDTLAEDEFVGAQIEKIEMESLDSSDLPKNSKWVKVKFRLRLGDRVEFGFRKNTVFQKSELIEIIEDQRQVGFGTNYIESIRARIEREYHEIGYSFAKVRAIPFEKNIRHVVPVKRVTFEIEEGPRVVINRIKFEGIFSFSEAELEDAFYSYAALGVQKKFYIANQVQAAADSLLTWLKSKGFLSAKLVSVSKQFNQLKDYSNVDLTIYFYEGDRTIIKSFQHAGVSVFSKDELMGILGISELSPLDLVLFTSGVEKLKEEYRNRGYLDAKILNEGKSDLVIYSDENRNVEVQLKIDEGPIAVVTQVQIEGIGKTHDEVVRRELLFDIGTILNDHLISDSESNIRKLGVFGAVKISTQDDSLEVMKGKPGSKIVKVILTEGAPGVIAGGVGYRTELGPRVFGQVAYSNLWRKNHTGSINGSINRRFDQDFCANDIQKLEQPNNDHCFLEYQVQFAYTWPWVFWNETTYRPRFTFERLQYRNFDVSSIALSNTFERNIYYRREKNYSIVGGLTHQIERIEQFNAQYFEEDNKQMRIGSLSPFLKIDFRDNSLNPTRGFYSWLNFEVAHPYLLSQFNPFNVAYTRTQIRTDGFIPLTRRSTLFLSFRSGYAWNFARPPATDPDNPNYSLPASKHFTMGGAGSLRGFKEQELNAGQFAIRGTITYVNYRAQLSLPFSGQMRFGPFLDAANLNINTYSFGNLRYGSGMGFHYVSPVGPVNFDFGIKLRPQEGEDLYRLYFSVGII